MLFVVVNGIPSNGTFVTVGSGKVETQKVLAVADLPASVRVDGVAGSASKGSTSGSGSSNGDSNDPSSSSGFSTTKIIAAIVAGVVVVAVVGAITGICITRRRRARTAAAAAYSGGAAGGAASGQTQDTPTPWKRLRAEGIRMFGHRDPPRSSRCTMITRARRASSADRSRSITMTLPRHRVQASPGSPCRTRTMARAAGMMGSIITPQGTRGMRSSRRMRIRTMMSRGCVRRLSLFRMD
jgi:hypothetical protein